MLVLSRKSRESIAMLEPDGVSCHLKITVLEIAPGRVKLGFEGGPEVPIHRWEVWQKMLSTQQCLIAPEPCGAPADRSTAHAEVSPQAPVIGSVLHPLFEADHHIV
jgi:carbon storage regulator CsrA